MGSTSVVEMAGITKRFPGVVANDRISFQVNSGEIHALLGENGAGKSTLMSVLTGLYRPDEGEIRIRGERVDIWSPRDALEKGIGMVHQHFKLVQPFTVAENLMLGLPGLKQLYDLRAVERDIANCSGKYGLELDPSARIWQLSVGEQQRVEIVKVLTRGVEVLILDEPTAVLTPQETGELYRTLRNMAEHGKAIVLISHKLSEVMENTDRITVLRGGKLIGTVNTHETNVDELARMMVGHDVISDLTRDKVPRGKQVICLHNVSVTGDRGPLALHKVSLGINEGEVLGIAGVAGNGQKALAEVMVGSRKVESGRVLVKGNDFTGATTKRFIDAGVSYIPEDRMTTGLVPGLNAFENVVLKNYRRSKGCFINWKKIRSYTDDLINRFDVKVADTKNPVRMMSGGNLQKLLLAREIESVPSLIVAVYPLRGLDIGAAESIKRLLITQRAKGKAILLISEELEDLFLLSDRIAIIHAGEIMGVVKPSETTVEAVGLMMAGQRAEYHAN